MIVDTSALLAFIDAGEPDHKSVVAAIESAAEPLVVSPYVVAELDYLIATRVGQREEVLALRELCGGAWDLAAIDSSDLAQVVDIVERYVGLDIGVADASNVFLADRHRTRKIATLDHRHFRALRPLSGGHFELLP